MNNSMKKLSLVLLAAVFSFSLAACEEQSAETLGERIDNKAEQAGNQIEDACEEVKEGGNAKDTDC
ncbi:hypothetical protein [Microbulbifer sp. THAF38]|uniref:hypothetical protein n=1 Tax=Microbulbifer sp. THAF38 TaxID=2587856 RepID=UPI0012A78A4E|nr:hypothetical protein [Microbulbifer sp. THAF38]QFT54664.1 hypothetical protein FIU95_08880 [Microbulbifer sp. THAF38]